MSEAKTQHDYLGDTDVGRMVVRGIKSISYDIVDCHVICTVLMRNGVAHKSHPVMHSTLGQAMSMALTTAFSIMESSGASKGRLIDCFSVSGGGCAALSGRKFFAGEDKR